MYSDYLWGFLILAAESRRTLPLGKLQELTSLGADEIKSGLSEIEEYCFKNGVPPLDLIADLGHPTVIPETVWAHNWSDQAIPESLDAGAEHSIGWYEMGTDYMRRGSEVALNAASAIVSKSWPAIRTIIKDKIEPIAIEYLSDDERVEHLARLIYPFLPTAVQFILREEDFVQVCISNKEVLLEMYSRRFGRSLPTSAKSG
jgi:hypothetical protein